MADRWTVIGCGEAGEKLMRTRSFWIHWYWATWSTSYAIGTANMFVKEWHVHMASFNVNFHTQSGSYANYQFMSMPTKANASCRFWYETVIYMSHLHELSIVKNSKIPISTQAYSHTRLPQNIFSLLNHYSDVSGKNESCLHWVNWTFTRICSLADIYLRF